MGVGCSCSESEAPASGLAAALLSFSFAGAGQRAPACRQLLRKSASLQSSEPHGMNCPVFSDHFSSPWTMSVRLSIHSALLRPRDKTEPHALQISVGVSRRLPRLRS